MKNAVVMLLATLICCTILTGCSEKTAEEQLAVYSFSGENENFAVSNGVIVLASTEEIFYGGDLEVSPGKFDDITAYSVTCYIISDNGKDILLSNSVEDMTGETIHISGDIGKRSGGDIIIRQATAELQNNLYCELETTDLDGEKNNYQLQLTLTEVTGKVGN